MLGDIGPWACAGMTGGRVYVRVNPEWNLDREAIAARLGEGAKVTLRRARRPRAMLDVQDLLGHYADELRGRPIRTPRPRGRSGEGGASPTPDSTASEVPETISSEWDRG